MFTSSSPWFEIVTSGPGSDSPQVIDSLVGWLQGLPPAAPTILHAADGQLGTVQVLQYEAYRWLQMEDASIQSLLDTRVPARLISPSNSLMLMALAFTKGRSRVLNLGLGGGAIERRLLLDYPTMVIDSVELDPRIVALARQHFFLPANHPVMVQDAEQFIANAAGPYDLVFCDLFSAQQHAVCLERDGFFAGIRRCLGPDGVCVLNLRHTDQGAVVAILKAARKQFSAVWLVELVGYQNVVVYCMPRAMSASSSQALVPACSEFLDTLDAEPLGFEWQLVALPDP